MLSSIFCDPMEWEGFMQEQEEDERSSAAESLGKSELSFNMKDLSNCIPCGAIATVSVTKHLVEETGCEMWTVDKHCCSHACTRNCDKSKDGEDSLREVSTKSSLDTVSSRLAQLLPLSKAG